MKANFRTIVFKRAHRIMRHTRKSFAVCLSKAWAIYRLIEKMKTKETEFSFEKVDGSLRHAKGIIRKLPISIGNRKPNYKSVAYFDIEKEAFRSFRVESLITIF